MYTCMCVDRTSVFPQGVRGKAVQEEADRMIEDLQLLDKRNTPSSALTGGMKRKLRCVHVYILVYYMNLHIQATCIYIYTICYIQIFLPLLMMTCTACVYSTCPEFYVHAYMLHHTLMLHTGQINTAVPCVFGIPHLMFSVKYCIQVHVHACTCAQYVISTSCQQLPTCI